MKKLIICPNEQKKNILSSLDSNSTLHDIKFMTLEEFKANYYFSYTDNTIYYLMKKYGYNLDVCRVYLENLYFIDPDYDYSEEKLIFLKNLKKELIDQKLLNFNPIFKDYLKSVDIEVINYFNLDKYLEKDLNYTFDSYECELNTPVYEFKSIEDEVNFVCVSIRKLLDRGVNINNIYLSNVGSEYNYILGRLFNYYGIPINLNYKDSIYGTTVVKEYLDTRKLDLDDPNKMTINKKIIGILTDLVDIDEDDIYDVLLIDKLKRSYIKTPALSNAVNICNINDYTFGDDDYVFVLGFNLDSLPNSYKDISFITDSIKHDVGLYDTNYLNIREKTMIKFLLSRIKNLTISYKLSSPFQKYYPSTLISDLNMKVIRDSEEKYVYSNLYNKIRLGEMLDRYYVYGEVHNDLELLNSNYNIKYHSYDNKFDGINHDQYLENIPYPLRLSYTSLNNFTECGFKYYINYVLKLGDYTDTFAAFVGSMYHHILTLYKKNGFDLNYEFDKYLEKRDLNLKEKLLLVKIRRDLVTLIDVLKQQQLLTEYNDEVYEKEIKVTFNKSISVEFVGYIDKIMFYKNMDDTYFSIIDYKTGTIDTSIELLRYGLHMQLPMYLFLINYGDLISNPIFTGIYYQNILFNYPTWSKSMDKEVNNRYLLKGYSTDNTDILSKFDISYKDSSYIKSMKYSDDKGFGTYTKLMDDATVLNMVKYVNAHIDKSIDGIIDGDFSINPKFYDGENISCKYCKFKDLCFMTNDDVIYLKKQDDLDFLGGEE